MRESNKEAFVAEARENLETMNAALVELEAFPARVEPLNKIFRAAHTIKGMAGMMGCEQMAALAHALEDVLDALRKRKLAPADCADLLFRCFDGLGEGLKAVERGEPEPATGPLRERLLRLNASAAEEDVLPARTEAAAGPGRVVSVPVKVERLDLLMNLAEELIVVKIRFDQLARTSSNPDLAAAVDSLDRLIAELQYQVTQVRMLPIGLVFSRFPRLVRDLAKQQKKEAVFTSEGGDIELDRVVSDEISESLLHLLRNAVDHGIETPERRRAAGKPAQGTIRVVARRTKDAAVIEVEDDGAGLDVDGIKSAAASRGLQVPDEAKEGLLSILVPGVSTSPETTTVSGRGLGLDIVKRKIRSLGGTLAVSTRPGKGAAFRMEIPLTLAVVKTLLVEVGDRSYAVPLAAIDRIAAVEEARVRRVMGGEAVVIAGREIRLLRLRALFGLPAAGLSPFPVVVVGADGGKLGLAVDVVVAAQEIVLKPLNRMLRESRHFAGSAIVGTGEAILVLDVAGLLSQENSEARA